MVDEAHALGTPVFVSICPKGERVVNEMDPTLINHCIRLGDELGADVTGVPYSGDARSFSRAVAASSVPVLVTGGPTKADFKGFAGMGVADEQDHPWLVEEKKAIKAAIAADRAVLGICLGAQLVAVVLGGTVTRNPVPEIGWFPVSLTEAGAAEPVLAGLPPTFMMPPGPPRRGERDGWG